MRRVKRIITKKCYFSDAQTAISLFLLKHIMVTYVTDCNRQMLYNVHRANISYCRKLDLSFKIYYVCKISYGIEYQTGMYWHSCYVQCPSLFNTCLLHMLLSGLKSLILDTWLQTLRSMVFFFCSGVSKLFGAQGSPSSGSLLNL